MRRQNKKLASFADEELMKMIANTEAKAFEVIYDRHGAIAYSLAFRICQNKVHAEEACQEAFISFWRGASRYQASEGSVRSWLLKIVHNRSIDVIRRNSKTFDQVEANEETLGSGPNQTEIKATSEIEKQEMHERMKELSVPQQQVVALSFYAGYTHKEISELLEMPLGSVKGHMRKALEQLKVQMEEEQYV